MASTCGICSTISATGRELFVCQVGSSEEMAMNVSSR